MSGPIPSELGGLVDLYTLYLGGNHLSGCIPLALRYLRYLSKSDLGPLGLPFCI